jgi:fluoride exporter
VIRPAVTGRLDGRELAAIFAGGMVGAVLRVWMSRQFSSTAPHWPWATFIVNVSGSVVLAYFATRLQERLPLSTYRRPLLGTGLCGAYTTFSTMQVEIARMLDHGRYGLAVGYAVASIAAGYTAIWITTAFVRRSPLT